MNNEVDEIKIYRPANPVAKYLYITLAALSAAVIFLGIQNYSLRSGSNDNKTTTIGNTVTPSPTLAPEDIALAQQDPTGNWRIYRNLTYGYKFRTPKNYQAKVNNKRNSVEIFNESDQMIIEVAAEPRSNTNTGNDSEKKETVGSVIYNVVQYPDGNGETKSSFIAYKTYNDKYTFTLNFYDTLSLNEMEKLILSTFSEVE